MLCGGTIRAPTSTGWWKKMRRRWFVDSDGPQWRTADYSLDFRVGGTETGQFELAEGPGKGVHRNVAHYLDIAENARIV